MAHMPLTVLATGQRDCFDSKGARIDCVGSGQNGALFSTLQLPQPRFIAQGEVARDRWTGLQWLACADLAQGPVSWCEALAVVAALLGHPEHPWCLPNITNWSRWWTTTMPARRCPPACR